MIAVKIGGSVITRKDTYRHFLPDVCRDIVKSLSPFRNELIMAHGGGSFGHILAKEANLPDVLNERTKRYFSRIHNDVLLLNSKIIDIMAEEGFNPVSIPTALFFGKKTLNVSTYRRFLESGFNPVGMGDIVLSGKTVKIISADDIMLKLSKEFNPRLVIFFTDVDGIFSDDPKKNPQARLLPTIDSNVNFKAVQNDVTGGMKHKYEIIKKISQHADRIAVINGKYPERLKDLGTERFIGTVIENGR
ncbi:MAG: isopentenyl phosphate kinase [Thermoplasmataceae archaeon]